MAEEIIPEPTTISPKQTEFNLMPTGFSLTAERFIPNTAKLSPGRVTDCIWGTVLFLWSVDRNIEAEQ
jgi:hypothetical protein